MDTILKKKIDALREKFSSQSHIFHWLDKNYLKAPETIALIEQLEKIDIENVLSRLTKSRTTRHQTNKAPQPVQNIVRLKECKQEQKNKWTQLALSAMAKGQVGVILLAGGQGTRLGFDKPKGIYNIGLPGSGSLFQKQAEQIIRLRELAAASANTSEQVISIPWFIMTSPMTDQPTRTYFKENKYFGIDKKEIFFFQQGTLPCFTDKEKIIMNSPASVATAPDGNGGIYPALLNSGALQHMANCRIEHLFQYCVDNAAIKVADPVFLGYCIENKSEIAGKAVEKKSANEQVGVFCDIEKRLHVLEYSDIDKNISESKDPETGALLLSASHVCINYFSRGFLEKVTNDPPDHYHIAKKKIQYTNEDGTIITPEHPNGIKLESFIFDVFKKADRYHIFECDNRKEEFAPVKNPLGSTEDSPDTARKLCSDLYIEQLTKAGASIVGQKSDLVEISPLVSYSGEGLERIFKGVELQSPLFIKKGNTKHSIDSFRHITPEENALGLHVYEVFTK